MKLYAHPFSSYSQKVLIALYANATPFEYRSLEEPSANAELAALWPLKRFPVLVDQGRTILEATTIIEYLQRLDPYPDPAVSALIEAARWALTWAGEFQRFDAVMKAAAAQLADAKYADAIATYLGGFGISPSKR